MSGLLDSFKSISIRYAIEIHYHQKAHQGQEPGALSESTESTRR